MDWPNDLSKTNKIQKQMFCMKFKDWFRIDQKTESAKPKFNHQNVHENVSFAIFVYFIVIWAAIKIWNSQQPMPFLCV